MNFINKNIVIILSLVLSYAVIYNTAEYLPGVIESLTGMHVEEGFFSKYRFPVAILALLFFPVINWIKKQLNSNRSDT
jgi:hypothetical protein